MIPEGDFHFGTQMTIANKLVAYKPKDGADPRKLKSVKSFKMDIDVVTNRQFEEFVEETGYITEAEQVG